jgi:hypothetical protein
MRYAASRVDEDAAAPREQVANVREAVEVRHVVPHAQVRTRRALVVVIKVLRGLEDVSFCLFKTERAAAIRDAALTFGSFS